jgi:hypothetical protein
MNMYHEKMKQGEKDSVLLFVNLLYEVCATYFPDRSCFSKFLYGH